ncbi:MAG: heat shock protein HspQ [Deltaproteobacteria bacterium]|nr:heat shock protein HspQ [bacterium]MCB9490285.1 heat shock protein HspQ [Deltaproteobacteria bacterium]
MATKFQIGAIIRHRMFEYRGVVIGVDENFQGTDEWYENVARSRPPKDRPWYHVLVHNSAIETYVAERNLEPDISDAPINHPYVESLFDTIQDGRYVRKHVN